MLGDLVVEHLPVGVVVLDSERRVQRVNRAGRAILRAADAELVGRAWDEVLQEAGTPARPVMEGSPPTLLTPAGRFELREMPLRTPPDGAGSLVVFRDVSDLARALDERHLAEEQVIRQERLSALGQMAAGIAHDLDNTLGQVALYAGLLAECDELATDRGVARDYVDLIRAGISDATSVIARIREFYRPRGERDVFAPADLGRLVDETIALTRPRWHDMARAGGRNVTVESHVAPVPPALVDAAALREALTNLLFNAVDALPNGGAISVHLHAAAGMITLAVRDNGVGMTPEQQARCLEPFYTTKGVHGTGLGLAMVHGIAQRHGGTVEIESEVGRGTWVALHLPLREAEPSAAPEAPIETRTPRTADAGAGVGERATGEGTWKALVVDDEAPMRNVIALLLAREGYVVETAPDGVRALQMMNAARGGMRAPYDVVVVDQVMPGLSGTQVAQTISAHSPRPPVVLATAFAYLIDPTALPPGVDVLVSKPFDARALREAIRAARAAVGRAD